jgi:Flp pilus assembly pilin Flp
MKNARSVLTKDGNRLKMAVKLSPRRADLPCGYCECLTKDDPPGACSGNHRNESMILTLLVHSCVYRALDLPKNVQDYPEEGLHMPANFFQRMWLNDEGQDIAEYAVMLAVILVIVVGTIRLIGANANNVFSSVASSISQ